MDSQTKCALDARGLDPKTCITTLDLIIIEIAIRNRTDGCGYAWRDRINFYINLRNRVAMDKENLSVKQLIKAPETGTGYATLVSCYNDFDGYLKMSPYIKFKDNWLEQVNFK